MYLNYYIAVKHDLKIGFLYYANFFLLQDLISKPWTKLANIGFGVLLAYTYMKILDYRQIKTEESKKNRHPIIHSIH